MIDVHTTPPYIATVSGRAFVFNSCDLGQIQLTDIAHALSQIVRFTGHVERFWSVGAHSLLVMHLARLNGGTPLEQLQALMHDAHEAYVGDISRPFGKVLGRPILKQYKQALDELIRRRYSFAPPTRPDWINLLDNAAGYMEACAFIPNYPYWHSEWFPDPSIKLWPHSLKWASSRPSRIRRRFLAAFDSLKKQVG